MEISNHRETVEQFFPNPDGQISSTTEAIVRGASGRRFRAFVLGGRHREVSAEVHYHVVEILQELAPARQAATSLEEEDTPGVLEMADAAA